MEEKFVKKYWIEDDILFYIHFVNDIAIRQVEVSGNNKICLSQDNPVVNESMLYDQNMEDLELNENDFISKEEFEKVWKI
jgi:hypothetical protein